jgi:CMP-N-acetylneuraminic acid synthetase
MAKGGKLDSLVSVTPDPCMCWVDNAIGVNGKTHAIANYHPHKRPNRQDRQDWYKENGAIYFTKRYVLEHTRCRLGGAIGLYVMPKERSFEIDDPLDWFVAEFAQQMYPQTAKGVK